MTNASDMPVVLGLADLGLPDLPEPPAGLIALDDVRLLPGANGLHDAGGRPIRESFLRRGFDLDHYPHARPEAVDAALVAAEAVATTLERIVFVQHAGMSHFGHLLTECAASLGPLLEDPRGLDGVGGAGAVLVVPARSSPSSAAVADLLGLPPQRVLSPAAFAGAVRARHAFVPRPSMVNRHGLARRHFGHVRRLLSRLHGVDLERATPAADRGEKLFLSRARLPSTARRIVGEEELERALASRGWRIEHPERLPLDRQLEALAAARTIAGSLGSALHLLMAFGEDVGRRRLLALGQGADRSNPNVALQAGRQGLPYRHLVCLDRDLAGGTDLRFLMPPDRIAACLDRLATGPDW
jgi:capsular polysaccharide biosynthesis protein